MFCVIFFRYSVFQTLSKYIRNTKSKYEYKVVNKKLGVWLVKVGLQQKLKKVGKM